MQRTEIPLAITHLLDLADAWRAILHERDEALRLAKDLQERLNTKENAIKDLRNVIGDQNARIAELKDRITALEKVLAEHQNEGGDQPAPDPDPPIIVHPSGEPFPADGILRSGKTYSGEVRGKLLRLETNARDVTICNADFDGTALLVAWGNKGCRNILFEDVRVTGFARNKLGLSSDVIAPIRVTEPIDGLRFTRCVFFDYDAYGLDLFHTTNLRIDQCKFLNVRQGIHLEGMRGHCLVRQNLFDGIMRMAVEIQDQYVNDNRLESLNVLENVLLGFRSPDHHSFGLSVMAEWCENVLVQRNWLNFGYTGDLRVVDGLRGMGIGIELNGDNTLCSANTLIMPHDRMAVAHATSGRNTRVSGDRIYGFQPARDGQRWYNEQPSRKWGRGNFSQYDIQHLPSEAAPPPPLSV